MANLPVETREALNRCRHLISRVGVPRRCSRNAHISPVGQIALRDRRHLGRRRR